MTAATWSFVDIDGKKNQGLPSCKTDSKIEKRYYQKFPVNLWAQYKTRHFSKLPFPRTEVNVFVKQLCSCIFSIDSSVAHIIQAISFFFFFPLTLPYWEYANDIRHDYWFSLNLYSSVGRAITEVEQEIYSVLLPSSTICQTWFNLNNNWRFRFKDHFGLLTCLCRSRKYSNKERAKRLLHSML